MSEHSLQSSHTRGISVRNAVPSAIEQDDLMLQQYEEATEITQETFLAAWQGLPAFRGDARFPTWLYRIAYNCSLKQLELRKRDRALQVALEAEKTLENTNDEQRENAELDARDRQILVQEHLSHLPTKYRIVLILRHLQDMT